MVHKHRFSYPETGRTSQAVTLGHLKLQNVFNVSSGYVGQVVLVFQPIPNRVLTVLMEGGFEKPRQTPPMRQFVGVQAVPELR